MVIAANELLATPSTVTEFTFHVPEIIKPIALSIEVPINCLNHNKCANKTLLWPRLVAPKPFKTLCVVV